MTRAYAGLVSLLISGTLGLAAQSVYQPPQEQSAGVAGMELVEPGAPVNPLTKLSGIAEVAACPVEMQARQGSGRGLLVAKDRPGQRPGQEQIRGDQPSQRIHLILSQGTEKPIVQARVLVRGFGAKARMEHALSSEAGATNLSRTLVVRMRPEGKESVAGELVLPGFTSVQTIELLALRYDDGSNWNALPRTPCSVKPDLLMLVADR